MEESFDPPCNDWVRYLRDRNKIWLVKEMEYAWVVNNFTPPEKTGGYAGKLFIRRKNGNIQDWFVREDGCGLNGQPLIRPVIGNLSLDPICLTSDEFEILNIRIEKLEIQINNIIRIFFGV
jgi:hypothetical protein